MVESSRELNSGHGTIVGRHMVIISDGPRVRRIGRLRIDERRRETAFDIAVDISLDATVDHFLGVFWLRLVSYGYAATRTTTLVSVRARGVGRPRDDG